MHFVKLTREPWPRLSLVRRVLDDDADYLGPFSSRKTAEKCLAALHDTFPVRQCSDRLPASPPRSPCVLAEMGRCLSPCDGSVDAATYAAVVRQLRDTLLRRPDEVVEAINTRMAALAADERFEEAGVHRDRLAAFVRPPPAPSGSRALTRCPEVVAARREDDGRWAVHVVRHGRLAAAGVIPPGADAHQYVAELRASAETVAGRARPDAGRDRRGDREGPALAGVRPASGWSTSTASGPARSPARPATSRSTTRSNQSRLSLVPFDERRDLVDRAPAGALGSAHDHRHRVREGRRRPDPRGRRGRSPPSTGSARSTR